MQRADPKKPVGLLYLSWAGWGRRFGLIFLAGLMGASLVKVIIAPHHEYFDAIQTLGRSNALLQGGSPYDGLFFYPLWVAIVLLPFAALPLEMGATLWFWANFLGWALSLLLIMRFLKVPWPWQQQALFLLALLLFAPVVWSMRGQIVVFLALGLAAFLALIQKGHPLAAGAALALLTAKPHLGLLLVLLLNFWAVRKGAWMIPIGSAWGIGILGGLSFLVRPSWLWGWLERLADVPPADLALSRRAFDITLASFLRLWFPELWAQRLHWGIAIGLSVAIVWWLWRRGPDVGASQIVALGVTAIFFTTPYNQGYDLSLLAIPIVVCWALAPQRPHPFTSLYGGMLLLTYFLPIALVFSWWPQAVLFYLPLLCLALWALAGWEYNMEKREAQI